MRVLIWFNHHTTPPSEQLQLAVLYSIHSLKIISNFRRFSLKLPNPATGTFHKYTVSLPRPSPQFNVPSQPRAQHQASPRPRSRLSLSPSSIEALGLPQPIIPSLTTRYPQLVMQASCDPHSTLTLRRTSPACTPPRIRSAPFQLHTTHASKLGHRSSRWRKTRRDVGAAISWLANPRSYSAATNGRRAVRRTKA